MSLIEKKIKGLLSTENITRNELQQLAVDLSYEKKNIFFNWGTRLGKSKCIMEIVKSHGFEKVLFVCSQNIHIQNFKDDCQKFGFDLSPYVFICWNSYHSYEGLVWDAIIQDEVDHSIDNHIAYLSKCKYNHVYFLTATISQEQEHKLRQIDYFKWTITSSQAMDWKILPLPTVWVKPIILNKNQIKDLTNLETWIDKLKVKANEVGWETVKNGKKVPTWEGLSVLRKGGERKLFFEKIKMDWFEEEEIFNKFKNNRTIFFLPGIHESKKLGNSVSSLENIKTNNKILDNFNSGKINYIISKKILVRGVNVMNVNWGYFGILDLKGTNLIQSTARVLLGVAPNIIIPYIKGSKEEIVLNKFLKSFQCRIKEFKLNKQEYGD